MVCCCSVNLQETLGYGQLLFLRASAVGQRKKDFIKDQPNLAKNCSPIEPIFRFHKKFKK